MQHAWIQHAADSILTLTQVPAAEYKLGLIPSSSWLGFQLLDTSYGWFHPPIELSSGSWMHVSDDSILWVTWVPVSRYELQLIPSCSWLRFVSDFILQLTQVSAAELDLQLTHILVYQMNLRTYSANYITFIVSFLAFDFSYHWFRLWLLLQEPWKRLRKP